MFSVTFISHLRLKSISTWDVGRCSMDRLYRVTIVTEDKRVVVEAEHIAQALKSAYGICNENRWHPREVNIVQLSGPEVGAEEGGWWTTSTPRRL